MEDNTFPDPIPLRRQRACTEAEIQLLNPTIAPPKRTSVVNFMQDVMSGGAHAVNLARDVQTTLHDAQDLQFQQAGEDLEHIKVDVEHLKQDLHMIMEDCKECGCENLFKCDQECKCNVCILL